MFSTYSILQTAKLANKTKKPALPIIDTENILKRKCHKLNNLRTIQVYFLPKIGRKFSLGRRNNILIKKKRCLEFREAKDIEDITRWREDMNFIF